MQTSIDVTDKSPEWQSRLNSKNTEDLLQLAVPNGFTGPRSSIFPLTSSDECGRVFNFVGNVIIDSPDLAVRIVSPFSLGILPGDHHPPLVAILELCLISGQQVGHEGFSWPTTLWISMPSTLTQMA